VVAIALDVKEVMRMQQIVFVGTSNEKCIPNMSPRGSLFVDKDTLY
jgi:hypothetical protein